MVKVSRWILEQMIIKLICERMESLKGCCVNLDGEKELSISYHPRDTYIDLKDFQTGELIEGFVIENSDPSKLEILEIASNITDYFAV